MTPLAHTIAKDATLPIGKRLHGTACSYLGLLNDVHFFECTEVFDSALHLGSTILNRPHAKMERLAFLPAPRTWLEMATPESKITSRVAWLLELGADDVADVRCVFHDRDGSIHLSEGPLIRLPMTGSDLAFGTYDVIRKGWKGTDRVVTDQSAALIYAFLAMINTPRIIGRRTHMPHRGLERSLIQSRAMVGKFPLRAWTEIVLRVTPPKVDDAEPHEAHLTGERALHFVRCHLRFRLGQIEMVSAHWRGDPALGIKQSRYKLAA